jgi:acetyl-CoA synthetase
MTHPFIQARDFLQQHRDDYAKARREFRWPALTQFNWALDFFDAQARSNNAPALWIVEDDGSSSQFSFAQMSERSNRVANFLKEAGVRRGDRILVMIPNQTAIWDVMLASIKLGAVIVPSTTQLTTDDLRDRIERGAIRHAVVASSETHKFAAMPAALTRVSTGEARPGWLRLEDAQSASAEFEPGGVTQAQDPLLLYFTSGTTARPKLVLHSHQSYPVGHLSTMYWIGLKPGDVHWNISSPGWAKHAWSCFFAPWNAGATIFVGNFARFNASRTLQTICDCAVTSLCAPPTVWRMLIQEDLASFKVPLRELVAAGEPLNPEVIEQVRRAWGITIRDGFGQTETSALIGNSPGQKVKPGSAGRPLPGFDVELIDLDGKPATEGEISLVLDPRPTGLMMGYEGDTAKTQEVTRSGRYRTGDVASIDADGYITYVGRADDVFKSSDYRISPFELESALIEHPAVAEAAVVPSPDPIRLSVPKAFVALRAGFAPDRELARAILDFARDRLPPYQRIRCVEFYELPKTISGKIRRVELRRLEAERSGRDKASRREQEYWLEDFESPKPAGKI